MKNIRSIPLSSLRAFAATAHRESLTLAASDLGVTPGAIGHHVRQLEEQFGVELLRRRGRGLELTALGRQIFVIVSDGFNSLETATAMLSNAGGSNLLTISADLSFSTLWLAQRLPLIKDLAPAMEIRLVEPVSSEHLQASGVDLIFSYQRNKLQPPGNVPFIKETFIAACSPALLIGTCDTSSPRELLSLPLLHIDHSNDDELYPTWIDWFAAAALHRPNLEGARFVMTVMAAQAAISGQGVILASESLLAGYLESKQLIRIAELGPKLSLNRYVFSSATADKKDIADAIRSRLIASA